MRSRVLAPGLRLPRPAHVLFLVRLAALAIVLSAVIALSDLHGPAQVLVLLVAHLALPAARTALIALLLAVAHMLLSTLVVELIALTALAALVILVVAVHALLVGLAHLFILALLVALLGALCVFRFALMLAHEDLLSVVSVSNMLPVVLRNTQTPEYAKRVPRAQMGEILQSAANSKTVPTHLSLAHLSKR
jgi:hypothetical protein